MIDVTDYITYKNNKFALYKNLLPGTEVKFDCLFHGKLWYFEGEVSKCSKYVQTYFMMSKYSLRFHENR
mgnify:CR=1 FL=1